jgi:hypothetical protein
MRSKIISKSKAGQRFWSGLAERKIELCYLCACETLNSDIPRNFGGGYKYCHNECWHEMHDRSESIDQFRIRMEQCFPEG